jgi:hypothetical protein
VRTPAFLPSLFDAVEERSIRRASKSLGQASNGASDIGGVAVWNAGDAVAIGQRALPHDFPSFWLSR